MLRLPAVWIVLSSVLVAPAPNAQSAEYVATGGMAAPEATQAAAADKRFVYAISNTLIAKYDRASGKRLATSQGPALHLNSGFLWRGKLYCAHSNYPQTPARSEVLVLDLQSMELTTQKPLRAARGSLTWVVRAEDGWWCNFAHYGDENHRTVLVRLDNDWREEGVWRYPAELIGRLGRYSISGGLWQGDDLLVTGHDRREIYRLQLPEQGTVLELVETIASPFPGQGIATDPVTGGLVGIERAKRRVVFAERQ